MFCDLTRNAWPNLIKDAKTKTNRAAWCLPFPCAWYCLHFSFCICVCVCFYISVLCFILSFNCCLLLIIFTFDYPCGFFGFGFTTFNWQNCCPLLLYSSVSYGCISLSFSPLLLSWPKYSCWTQSPFTPSPSTVRTRKQISFSVSWPQKLEAGKPCIPAKCHCQLRELLRDILSQMCSCDEFTTFLFLKETNMWSFVFLFLFWLFCPADFTISLKMDTIQMVQGHSK